MEPTLQSTIQQHPVSGNQTVKFVAILLIGFVGLIGAFLVMNNTFNNINRASTTSVCRDSQTGTATCIVNGDMNAPGIDPARTFVETIETCGTNTRAIMQSLIDYKKDPGQNKFDTKAGCTYSCKLIVGANPVDGTVCQETTPDSLACGGPTITPPCPDCVDGKFMCEGPKDIPLKAGKDSSCPALAVHNIKYTPFTGQNACSNQTPTNLDCNTDEVFIVSTQQPKDKRKLTKSECLELSNGKGFDTRLHTALNNGCREYEIQVFRNGVRFDELCQDCKLKSGCPVACEAPVELAKTDLVDVSINSKFDKLPDTVPIKCGIIPNSNPPINCDVTINQNSCGKQVTFIPHADGTLYIDDHYNDTPKINIKAVKNVAIPFSYDNAGHYDVVLSCGDPENGKIDQACAKRITIACLGGDNPPPPPPPPGGSPTPTQPISCPKVPIEGVCI